MEVKIVTIEGIVFESMEVTSITIPTTLGSCDEY
ncbi:MAG: hypothetical protein KatS3mg085_212 [Candidatus Dojkabacteria bacterium]|nr:MAG: hypothetical protein KatS3mg085_212 [Candidatus Dojkabacteria bacterium]